MKYTVLKRTIAAFAAGLMLLQTPMQTMATVVSENSAVYKADEVSETAEQDLASVSGNATGQELEDVKQQKEKLLLNYAYIENGQIEPGMKQNIMISLGQEDAVFTEAELTLVHAENGQQIVISAAEIYGNTLLFTADTTGWEKGVYRIEKVHYGSGEIRFSDVPDMENVCFGLGVENPLPESEFIPYDSDATELTAEGTVVEEGETDFSKLIDMNVISLNGDEQAQTISDGVAETIEAARHDLSQEGENAKGEKIETDTASQASTQEGPAVKTIAGSVVVVIDPGHDASHAGARANGLTEEDLTLKVANYCKEYLEDNYTNVVVHMTRSSQACPYPGTASVDCNAKRVEAAYKVGADVLVSIHFNSTAGTTTASGAMVFYPNSNYNNSVGSAGATLASKIIEQLEKIGLKNNGIRIRNSEDNTTYPDGSLADYYAVIRRSKLYGFPGVIVEHAFINNPQDAAFLKSEDNLKKMGIADALGIAAAYNLTSEEVEYDAEDLQVTDIDGANGSFKIVLSGATPTSRIAEVRFKVYPVEDSSQVYWYTAEDEGAGVYTAIANVQNHGKKTGKYKIFAYAYDAAGKKNQLRSTTAVIEEAKLDTTAMKLQYKIASNEKKVSLTLKGNPGAAEVYFKVYSKDGGKNDIKKYVATKQKDGSWKATVTIANHKSSGDYVVTAYSKSYFGTTTKVKTGNFYIEGPATKSIKIKKLNLSQGTFQICVKGVASKAGVKKVSVEVKTLDGTKVKKVYTPKKTKAGYYYVNIKMKDFKYQYGRYGIYVKVTDGNNITKQTKDFIYEIKQPEPSITLKLKSRQTKLTMTASDLGIAANVKGVAFKVYHTSNPSRMKTYTANKSGNGSYTKTIFISDFGKSGDYKVLTYVKGANGKYKRIGKAQTITVADVTGGTVAIKKKSDNALYLAVKDIQYKGTIAKVEVRAWPLSNPSAKYTYKAPRRVTGSYRALIDSKNHKGAGGTYRYQVIVTTNNGIQKILLKGNIELAESAPDTRGLYAISGSSEATVAQMMAYYNKYAQYPSYYKNSDAPNLKKFCQIYYSECEKEGIRVEVAFAQAMKETGFLRFGGDVSISQYNFAGIGAVGGGAKGQSFTSVRLGVRAQVQHLKAYANEEPLNQKCVDPRFNLVTRGCAPYVEWLGIPDNPYGKGWATANNYGSSILQMIANMKNC